VKRNGHYGNGRQRWWCASCRRSFHWTALSNKERREKCWFLRWLTEGYSVRQLHQQSTISASKLQRSIHCWLKVNPIQSSSSYPSCRNLIFDGTFLYQRVGIVAIMDVEQHTVIAGRYGISESSRPSLRSFLEPLQLQGLSPESVTLDGNPNAIKIIKELWPSVVIQRCIVHIQRQGLMWCRRNPKRPDAKSLRRLFLAVTTIHTHQQRDEFLAAIHAWEARYGHRLDRLPDTGWVLSDIQRARSMLLKAIPNMFHYLDNPRIPKTTNGLEGYFSRLKQHYRQHRGLAPHRRLQYFNWYFFMCPR
jgi:hypothetical protein